MLVDTYDDGFDAALPISGCSDLIPPAAAINTRFANKHGVVGFPPNRQLPDNLCKEIYRIQRHYLLICNLK